MKIEDNKGISDLLVGEAQQLCTGFGFIEGPVWVASDNALLFSDIPNDRSYRWRPGTTVAEVFRGPSGMSNANTLDAEGNVVICEHAGRRVSRAAYDQPNEAVTIAGEWDGKRLNSPNDLVVHSSGSIFFTDPNFGCNQARVPLLGYKGQTQELTYQGVYRIDPDGSLHCLVSQGFYQPNGLVFTPDESALYINDSMNRIIWRFEMNSDLTLGKRTLFVDQHGDPRPGNPDGMKVDTEGRLWTTGAGGVSVHTPGGEYLGVFETDTHAANLAFGGDAFSTLFLTAGTTVWSVETAVRGIAPGSH